MNINAIPVEAFRLSDVKNNVISAKSATFKFRDTDLQPYLTPCVSNFRTAQEHPPQPRSY